VRGLSARYHAAIAAIDAANADDPNRVEARGDTAPLALVHGRLATEWVERLVPTADESLLLAARAHHLRRWVVPRSSYPEGRPGYLRWRRDQKARHAIEVGELLAGCGYDPETVRRVQALVRRDRVDGAQAVEDAACLVFLETQLGSVAGRLEHDLLIEVIRKTAAKMSGPALVMAAEIPLGAAEAALLREAFGTLDET
jgi:hypothetical protein